MKEVKVLIIAGQSNALGISPVKDLPQEKQREYKTKIYFNTNTPHPFAKKWMGVRAGFGHAKDLLFGLELPVAARLEDTEDEYCIVKYASDGTCLHEKWSKAKNGDDWLGLEKTIKQAVADLTAQGKRVEFAGFLWQQGCSDAVDEEKSAAYENNLKTFLSNVRAITDTNMPVAIGSVHPVHSAMLYAGQVIAAQKQTAKDLDKVYFVDTDGIEELVDAWHYNAKCEWALGERLFDAIMPKN
jgi:hypothetical protein